MSSLAAPVLDAPALRRYGPPELVFGANPAAAAHFVFDEDAGYWWRLLSVHVRLVTDANAADRQVVLEYRDIQDQRFDLMGINATQAASLTADYVFSAFQPGVVATVDSSSLIPLHPTLLYPGCDFRLFVVNVQAGDQLSRVRFQLERFYPPDDVGQPE